MLTRITDVRGDDEDDGGKREWPPAEPALVGMVGSERIFHGSDYSWTPAAAALAQIAAIDAAVPPVNDSWRALTTRNAERLLLRAGTGQGPALPAAARLLPSWY